jgi:hypothetical protein
VRILLFLLLSVAALASPPPRLLVGKVLGPDGRPVAHAGVFITTDFWDPDNKAVAERFPDRTYDTAADGSFVVPSQGQYRPGVKLLRLHAVAAAEGFSSSDEITTLPEGTHGYVPPVIHLRPAIAVTVLVIDSETQVPIAGATVTPPRFGNKAIVKVDGIAVFPGRDDRSQDQFAVAAAGYEPSGITPIAANPVQRMLLRKLWPLVVRVLGLDGKPLASCNVRVGTEEKVTDADGKLEVLAPHGSVYLAPLCRQDFDHPGVVQHSGTHVQELRVRPNMTFVGQVVDKQARPIAGVGVAVRPRNEISTARPMALAQTATDVQGHFRFDSFSADDFFIGIEDRRYSGTSIEVMAKTKNDPIVLIATPNAP